MTTPAHKHPSNYGAHAEFIPGQGWKPVNGKPLPKPIQDSLYPGWIPPDQVKRHGFLDAVDPTKPIRLPAVCPKSQPHTPSPYERRLPSAKKSLPRSVVAKNHPADCTPYQGLMLVSGKVEYPLLPAPAPVLLLGDGLPKVEPSTIEQLALEAIRATEEGYPVGKFMGDYGVPILNTLLHDKAIKVKNDRIYAVDTTPAAPDMLDIPLSPATPTRKPADIFKQAEEHKRLMKNTNLAFTLVRGICNDGNEVVDFLRKHGIHSGTACSDEQLAEIQQLVTAEELKYVDKTTLATLNIYGEVVYGKASWQSSASSGANKYSNGRTRHMGRLYQAQAEAWIADLEKKVKPFQKLDIEKRLAFIQQSARKMNQRGTVQQ